jgi:hypothetical protein
MTQIFVDHQVLANIAANPPSECYESDEYKSFLDLVRQKVYDLDSDHRQVTVMYYFENLEANHIAAELDLDQRTVYRLLRESLRILKASLAEAVKSRWPGRFDDLKSCPICNHPERTAIEKIIRGKKAGDSWSTINKKLKKRIGRIFNPPNVMINHIKYHDKE